ncbi:MAG TPA: ABC transporter ATP-binding protein [Solirubrobacterales bacterium]|jgi:ABC-type polysaccharide/polyol phosphate transport system ATPase subunit|nr:ABC transporter ATP-binding protein [Solirubrobacterales bacterium]
MSVPAERPLAIQVEDVKKTFRIPTKRVDSLKERAVHPFASRDFRELRALDGVSFEIHQGEFFGIVGRNGSGKSTLLKILASIYKADAGRIRMAGRLAPFIELGVGFNVELTARENVILNGVMMGLTQRETRGRLDAVLEFAELHDFADLKLKNFSSGMLVRLAFSTMMQADADILLIDEVLAVGDAAFQQKCADAFHEMKAAGKTIILVTHEMKTVEEYCHRAMLIDAGEIRQIGDPAEIGRQYLRLNFQPGAQAEGGHAGEGVPAVAEGASLVDAWIEDEHRERASGVEHGEEIRLRAEIELSRDTIGVSASFIVANADGVGLFQFSAPIRGADGSGRVYAGDRVAVSARLANPLAPGRYFVHAGVRQDQGEGDVELFVHGAVDFVVFGGERSGSLLALDHEVEATVAERSRS